MVFTIFTTMKNIYFYFAIILCFSCVKDQKTQEENPYECVLSFDKYINTLDLHYKNDCKFAKETVPFLKDVEGKMILS